MEGQEISVIYDEEYFTVDHEYAQQGYEEGWLEYSRYETVGDIIYHVYIMV